MVKYYKSFTFLFIFVIILNFISCKLENGKLGFSDGVYVWKETLFDFSERVITPDSVNKTYHIIIKGNNVDFYKNEILIDQGQWYKYGFRNYENVVISGNNTIQFKKREYHFIQDHTNYYCTDFPFINPGNTCYNYFVKQP